MNKQLLLSFIKKYTLGGKIEGVAWEGTTKGLKARIITDDKNLIGEVVLNDSVSQDFAGKKFGILNTSKLAKMLGVLSDEINASITDIGGKQISVKFTDDKNTKIAFALSDLAVVPTVPVMKYIPKDFEVKLKMNSAFVDSYIRATSALQEVVSFSLTATDKKVELILGQTDINTDTVTLHPEVIETKAIQKLYFSSTDFKEILNANKGIEAELCISEEGLSKIEFVENDFVSTYFLVGKKNQ